MMVLRKLPVFCVVFLLSGLALADGFRQTGTEGRQTEFEGTLTLSGRFERRQDAETLVWRGDRICFYPDADAVTKLPRDASGKSNTFFCFSNHLAAAEKLQLARSPAPGTCGVTGTATATISRYIVESGSNVFDQAWLDKVEKQGPTSPLRCP